MSAKRMTSPAPHDGPAPHPPAPRAGLLARVLRPLRRWATPIFAILTVAGLVLALWGQRAAIADFDWTVSPAILVGSALLFTVPVFAQGLSWWVILRLMGAPSRAWPSFLVWMRGFLVRYAPTGTLVFALRVRERDRMGVTKAQVMLASGYEQLMAPLAGALVAVCAALVAGGPPSWVAVLVLAVLLGVAVWMRPAWGGRLIARFAAKRGIDLGTQLRGRYFTAAVAINVVAWPFAGAAAWLMLDALTPNPPGFWPVLAGYSFAWLLGVIVPLLPGGLGLREATLAALLAPTYGLGVATTLALALRLVNTIAEFIAIGMTEAAALHPAARRAARPDSDEGR